VSFLVVSALAVSTLVLAESAFFNESAVLTESAAFNESAEPVDDLLLQAANEQAIANANTLTLNDFFICFGFFDDD
jgi:hypothetical protein